MDVAAILPALDSWGNWAYLAIFAVSAFEATPLLGTAVPGVTVVAVAGFGASQGFFEFWPLLWAAALGAFLGDLGGYWLGVRSRGAFTCEGRFLNERHLARAKAFFVAHGGKSILLGRFSGVMRATVPFVAGASSMPFWAFLFWNAVSAIPWTVLWIGVGWISGGAVLSAWDLVRSIF